MWLNLNGLTDGLMGWINDQRAVREGHVIDKQPNVHNGQSKQADSRLEVRDRKRADQQKRLFIIS